MSAKQITHLKGEDLAARLSQSPAVCHLLDDWKAMHDEDGYWLSTSAAIVYCMAQTRRTDIEWHSVLLENRRSQTGLEAVVNGRPPKGNAARLGKLFCMELRGKFYYRQSDLDEWLAQLPPAMKVH